MKTFTTYLLLFGLMQSLINCSKVDKTARSVQFEVEGKTYRFNLSPSTRIRNSPKLWTVKSKENYQKVDDVVENISDLEFYEDISKRATFFIKRKEDNIYYTGIFSEGSKTYVIDDVAENNSTNFETSILNARQMLKPLKKSPTIGGHSCNEDYVYARLVTDYIKLRKPLQILYPKILAVVDYHLFKILDRNISKTVQYVRTYWNAVDLMYASIESPQVKIALTGIIIAQDEHALEYVYLSRNENDKNIVNPKRVHARAAHYFSKEFNNYLNFTNYDVAAVMSGLDTEAIYGAAQLGKICDKRFRPAVIIDNGLYNGLINGIHELGHLLGMAHDGILIGTPCGAQADKENLCIMSSFSFWAKEFLWSECSIKLLQTFASMKASKCLKNPPY